MKLRKYKDNQKLKKYMDENKNKPDTTINQPLLANTTNEDN